MEISAVNSWLNSDMNYSVGVMLYERFGTDDYLKELFAKGCNAYTKKKLPEVLSRLSTAQRAQPVAIKQKTIYAHDDFATLPTDVQDVISAAKKLFKENAARQNELEFIYSRGTIEDRDGMIRIVDKADVLKVAVLSNTILDADDEITVLFNKIDYYEKHKVLPVDVVLSVAADEYESAFEVERALQRARQFISKNKNKPLKAAEVASKIVLRDELERRRYEFI